MVSLFVYADIGPCLLPGYQRRVVAMAPMVVLVGNPHRKQREVDEFLLQLEWLADGISDDG